MTNQNNEKNLDQLNMELAQLDRDAAVERQAWRDQARAKKGKRDLLDQLWSHGGKYLDYTMASKTDDIVEALSEAKHGVGRRELKEAIEAASSPQPQVPESEPDVPPADEAPPATDLPQAQDAFQEAVNRAAYMERFQAEQGKMPPPANQQVEDVTATVARVAEEARIRREHKAKVEAEKKAQKASRKQSSKEPDLSLTTEEEMRITAQLAVDAKLAPDFETALAEIRAKVEQARAEKASKPEKPAREKKPTPVKVPLSQIVTDSEITGQNIWNAGTHDLFGTIPADFRIRQDGAYRVDHFSDGAWHRYINGAGREGFATTPASTMAWLRRWAYVELGLPRPEAPKPVKQEESVPEPQAETVAA